MNRREFLETTTALGVLGALPGTLSADQAAPSAAPRLQMKIALTPGSIGVVVKTQAELNALAHRHQYEAVEPRGHELTSMSADQLQATLADLKSRNLVWAAAGLPVDFRASEETFAKGMAGLPRMAAGLQRAGVTRVGTWLTPNSDTLTYREHFQQTAARLREIGHVLKDHDLRLGLESVGTQRSLVSRRYPFVHTLAETLQTIGYDGPVRPEPFNQVVNAMENDEACAVASAALHKAMGAVRTG